MKTWTRQPDGSYQVRGEVHTRRVRLHLVKPVSYKLADPIYPRAQAEQLIADAIARGLAQAEAYQLLPVEEAPLDEATQQRLAALREKRKADRWREPAATRSEAAQRAWATRRKRDQR